MKEGDKFIHTDDISGRKYELTYTGTRREVKGCEFEFFEDDKGKVCFFTDSEVKKMEKVNMMHNEIEFNGDDLVKSVESFAKTI